MSSYAPLDRQRKDTYAAGMSRNSTRTMGQSLSKEHSLSLLFCTQAALIQRGLRPFRAKDLQADCQHFAQFLGKSITNAFSILFLHQLLLGV